MPLRLSFSFHTLYTGAGLAFLLGFSIPVSTALSNITFALLLLFVILQTWRNHTCGKAWQQLPRHGLFIPVILILLIMLTGILYASIPWNEALLSLNKYREFALILFLLVFFSVAPEQRRAQWAMRGFLLAMLITLILALVFHLTGWHYLEHPAPDRGVFKNYLTQNVFMALAAFIVAVKLKYAWRIHSNTNSDRCMLWCGGYILFIVLAAYHVFFISKGRIGYVLFFVLLGVLWYQSWRIKGILLAGIIMLLSVTALYFSSSILQQRIDQIGMDLRHYQQGDMQRNSIGLRLQFYQNSLKLIGAHPLLGTGSGSFVHEYQKIADKKQIIATHNPHNEYLLFMVQWGLAGLLAYLYFLYCLWRESWHLEVCQRDLAQGIWAVITIGCLFNSFWLDNGEGHLFALMIGLLYCFNTPREVFR